MNTGRIVGGGLVAGLLINILDALYLVVIGSRLFHASLQRLSVQTEKGVVPMQMDLGATQAVWYVICNFILGGIIVWMYAATRPRLGPGLRTAAYVGVVGGILIFAIPGFSLMACGIFPPDPLGPFYNPPLLPWIVWGMIETPIASIAGASLYREGNAREFA